MNVLKKNFFLSIWLLIVFATSVLFGVFFFLFEQEWVDFSLLEKRLNEKSSIVLDYKGNEFIKFELDKRAPVTFGQLPDVLVKAVISAEDHNFFSHYGISFRGIFRSALVNLYHRRYVQGASTITQQLAKLVFTSYEKTFLRKIKDMFLAFQLERQFTKQQIFEFYLNKIYLGRGIYGVGAACKRFWNKDISEITLDEAAILAAAIKSANLYSPLNDVERSRRRRNIVLRSMFRLGFIDEIEFVEASSKDIVVHDHAAGNPVRMYLKEWIRTWAENKFGRDALYSGGLQIKTTIDLDKQALAEYVLCRKILEQRKYLGDNLNGGMISIESFSGKIRATVGGFDFNQSQFNRSFQAVRQMGSVFKPIIYSVALKNGFKMNDLEVDEQIERLLSNGQIWSPNNWNNSFEGKMTLLKALTFSNNIVTVKVFEKLGANLIIDWAKKFGIHRGLMPYPSLALGIAEATTKECVAAFNVFANNGKHVKPYLFEWVKNKWGKKLWSWNDESHFVLDSKTNSKMINALSYRIKRVKLLHGPKNWINAEAIGKSGSTNSAATTWFVGSTPELTTAVYIGRDDNKPMGKRVFASQTAFPVWLEFNKGIDFTQKHFYLDPELKKVPIDWNTGKVLSDKNIKQDIFILQ